MANSMGRCLFIGGLAFALLTGSVRAEPALDWLTTVNEAASKIQGLRSDRARTIAWLAAFNALNTIDPRYRAYEPAPKPPEPPEPTASSVRPSSAAALAAALYTALIVEPDVDQALLARRYRETLASVSAAPEREAGVALGRQAAMLLLASRMNDRYGRIEAMLVPPAPGVFVTPGYAKMPYSTTVTRLAPFGVRAPAGFDPGSPPAVGSDPATREIAEVRSVGALTSSSRSGDQTAAALFWNSSQPVDYEAVTKPALEARKLDTLAAARIFALEEMIGIDTAIANTLFKDRYQRWRPETAIAGPHAAASDREPSWQPLVRAPNSPDYPSGGGTGAGVMSVVLPRLYGLDGPIEMRNEQTQQTRRWASAAALADELASARVWGGVHFRSAVEAGRRVGVAVATEVIERQLLPR